jgi:hypothetical protein
MGTFGDVSVGNISTGEYTLAVMKFLDVCLSSYTGVPSDHLVGAHL